MEQLNPSEQKKLDMILEVYEADTIAFDTIARFVYANLEGGESPDGHPVPPPDVVRGAMLVHIHTMMKVVDICSGKI